MLSDAKHLHFLIANKQLQILRFAQDDSTEAFFRSLPGRDPAMNREDHGPSNLFRETESNDMKTFPSRRNREIAFGSIAALLLFLSPALVPTRPVSEPVVVGPQQRIQEAVERSPEGTIS